MPAPAERQPIFIDDSGRRHRAVRVVGWVTGAIVVAYLGLLAVSLVGGPDLVPVSLPAVGRLLPGPKAPLLATAGTARSNVDAGTHPHPATALQILSGQSTAAGATTAQPGLAPPSQPARRAGGSNSHPSPSARPNPAVTPSPSARPSPSSSASTQPHGHSTPRSTHRASPSHSPHGHATPTATPTA